MNDINTAVILNLDKCIVIPISLLLVSFVIIFSNFFYNEKLTLKQNEAVMANNIKIHEYGITTIKINNLSFTDIYEKCRGICYLFFLNI